MEGYSPGGKRMMADSLFAHARVEFTDGPSASPKRTTAGHSHDRRVSGLGLPLGVGRVGIRGSILPASRLLALLSFLPSGSEQQRHRYCKYGVAGHPVFRVEVVADDRQSIFHSVGVQVAIVHWSVANPRFPQHVGFRAARIRRGLTQAQVAARARVHVNTIRKIENGVTREVTKQNAAQLSRALKASIEELGLKIRQPVPPSIRLRQLSVEERQLLDEILALPAAGLEAVREVVRVIREKQVEGTNAKKRR